MVEAGWLYSKRCSSLSTRRAGQSYDVLALECTQEWLSKVNKKIVGTALSVKGLTVSSIVRGGCGRACCRGTPWWNPGTHLGNIRKNKKVKDKFKREKIYGIERKMVKDTSLTGATLKGFTQGDGDSSMNTRTRICYRHRREQY